MNNLLDNLFVYSLAILCVCIGALTWLGTKPPDGRA